MRRITVSIRAADQELLDQLVARGEARSVSAAFRLICDAYRTVQAGRTFAEVARRIDHRAVLRGVGLLDEPGADPPGTAGPRWSALVTNDRPGEH
jgi:hypothetical protein